MAYPDTRNLVVTDSPAAALYQPGRIGTLQLRNRFVQAPIFTQFASTFGEGLAISTRARRVQGQEART
ncbi:hypothetical protein [Pseudomonas fluorescens]|uniref:Uncharacterized protein n=1 Tax=Pseudomonas fluorescens TaxID=294 RepID=A0A5E7DND4_PSEFL|nr:hypothetical protein [Pseudomonas fluorescens]VVO19130.1 hypothetical protein PS710_04095 [Pseudomonas fluorescens]